MRAAVACLLLPVLLGAGPEPAPPAGDHVAALAQTWSCRTLRREITHHDGVRKGQRIEVVNDVRPAGDAATYVLNDRYEFDPDSGQWRVSIGTESPIPIEGVAPPWPGETWVFVGRQTGGATARMTYDFFSERDMRRKIEFFKAGEWELSSAERCSRGEEPPSANVCIASSVEARLTSFAPVEYRLIPPNSPEGTVEIVVHLDERSRVRSTSTVRSPSGSLTAAFVQALRASTFQTEIYDCRTLAADVTVTATFAANRFSILYRAPVPKPG